MAQGNDKAMIRSSTRSLAQLLASTGHDDEDIFVARAINTVRNPVGADRGEGFADEVRSHTGIIRLEGGVDFHKFNMTMALVKNQARAAAEDTATTPEIDVGEDTGRSDAGTPPVDADSGGPDISSGPVPETGPDPDPVPDADPVSGDNPDPVPDTDDDPESETDPETDPGPGPDDDPTPDADTIISSSTDDDILSGGDGMDTFVFGPDGSYDIITNFDVGNDVLDLRAYGFASVEEALSHVVADGSGMAFVIDSDTIILNDVNIIQALDISILFV